MTAPAVFSVDASDLAATVERARALLDDGDVIAARLLAAGVYDQAKAAASFASRFGAARRLVDKARRLQGDALLIESRSKLRIADEVDAAQAAGVVAKAGGDRSIISSENNAPPATLAEIGLTAQDVHEARKLRDAERRAPGIVERAIAARLAAGLEPSRANLRAAIGTDTATAAERGHNLYETPGEAMRTLLALERFSRRVKEPACGRGAIVRPLEDAGYDVDIADLVDYGTATQHGEVQRVENFLTAEPRPDGDGDDIVTNPPYGADLNGFVARALLLHRPRKMALLLNLNFLCGTEDEDRCYALDENPPARILVFARRLPMMHRDGWDGNEASSRMNTAWFVWERDADGNYSGKRETIRVDWQDYAETPPLPPLDGPDLPTPQPMSRKALPVLAWEQAYAGGRILARTGEVEVGAVFPDGEKASAKWSFWLGSIASPHHKARSVDAAKAALLKRWGEFLKRANLQCGGAA